MLAGLAMLVLPGPGIIVIGASDGSQLFQTPNPAPGNAHPVVVSGGHLYLPTYAGIRVFGVA